MKRAAIFLVAAAVAAGALAGEVWSPNPLVPIVKSEDYAGRDDPKCTVRLVGTRNAPCCGQVVFYSPEPVKGPEAKLGELKTKQGGTIPPEAADIFYAVPSGRLLDIDHGHGGKKNSGRFDGLLRTPRAQGKVHLVWITVRVPADAAPGEYEGTLDYAERKIPVRLRVSPWRAPDPKDFSSHVGFVQSPDSVALQYGAALWSEKHWALVTESLKQLARVGNRTVYIPMLAQTHFGNDESVVRWIKDGEAYKHDFAIMEKYLDLYLEHVGKPEVVCFYVWGPRLRYGWGKGETEKIKDGEPPRVTLLDPATGKTELLDLPHHGPETAALWKPVMDGARERVKARGLDDKVCMVGFLSDKKPPNSTIELFKQAAPGMPWVVHAHPLMKKYRDVQVGYICHVWGVKGVKQVVKKRRYGWQQKPESTIVTAFPRYGASFVHRLGDDATPGIHQCAFECASLVGIRGIGRIGADFWPVLEGARHKRNIINRYLSRWGQLTMSNATSAMLYPGPEGAMPTTRFELLCQGIAEAEARIAIERVLLDKAQRAKLGEELAKKCEALLDERMQTLVAANGRRKDGSKEGWNWFSAEANWQESAAKLFDLAAEVAKKLGG